MSPAASSVRKVSWPARLGARLRRRLAPPTIVLLYHRVVPRLERDVNKLATRTENFAAQLAWLRSHARPLTPRGFLDHFERPRRTRIALDGGKPRVVITFDDGYADNVRHALPVLQEHGLRATLFVSSGLVGTPQPFWWDALEQIVYDGPLPPGGWRAGEVGPVTAADRAEAYQRLHGWLKPLPAGARQAALVELARQAGRVPLATPDSRPVTWDELQAWVAAGMAVGGHTRTHPQLSALDITQQRREITLCRHDLEERLAVPIHTFAYPYGSADSFDQRCADAVRAAGFRCAFANRDGNARWARSPYAVPRCLVRDWSVAEFAARFGQWCQG
jgi:peptidoglycan/xylan/chitin deacetylase (PgdA/CDA1 family)